MQLDVRISLTPFAWNTLEHQASAEGFDVTQFMEQACAYYLSELDSGRVAAGLPRFANERQHGTARMLQLELDDDRAARLDREAEGRGASRELLLRHATLLYLADLDAGRVAERVTRRDRAGK